MVKSTRVAVTDTVLVATNVVANHNKMKNTLRRGQVSMELMATVILIVMIFISVTYLSLLLRGETLDRNFWYGESILCANVADTVNVVYSGGPGAKTVLDVQGNVTLRPGLVEVNDGENTFYCPVDYGAMDYSRVLSPGAYEVSNGGGRVVFT